MVDELEQIKRNRLRNGLITSYESHQQQQHHAAYYHHHQQMNNLKQSTIRMQSQQQCVMNCEVIALHISPDLGERIMVSGERPLIDEIFPETSQAFTDSRSNVAWNQLDGRQIIRFPLNGYCKLNSIQVLTRLFNRGFVIKASTGGGVEGQQFSEYLLVRGCAL